MTFRNLRNEDLTLIPGTLIFCGITPSKTSPVRLNLTDEHGKQHRHLQYLGDGPPYQTGCAGQVELYVVVLHRGEFVTLPLDIGKYVDLSDSKQYVGVEIFVLTFLLIGHFRFRHDKSAATSELLVTRALSQEDRAFSYA